MIDVNSRVVRDVFLGPNMTGPKTLRRGRVIGKVALESSSYHDPNPTFTVKWDDGVIEGGYLASGLREEPMSVGALGL